MVATMIKSNKSTEWPLRRLKMKTMEEKKISLDSTILAMRGQSKINQSKVNLNNSFRDLAKSFEEMRALFEETDMKVEAIRNSMEPKVEVANESENDCDDSAEDFMQETIEEENVTGAGKIVQEKCDSRKDWNSEDPTVPQGWKTKICPNGGGKMQKKFLDPLGKVSDTRKQALERMNESGRYSEEEIHLMKSHMNNKLDKVFRKVDKVKRGRLNEVQEAVDELKELEAKVRKVDANIKKEPQSNDGQLLDGSNDNIVFRKENSSEGDNLASEDAQSSDLAQMDWVRWEEEQLLPKGWSYKWHKQRSIQAKSGFKRSLFFITNSGDKLKSSNEAFKYMVENDFPEIDQERMRTFVQGWKNVDRRKEEVAIKKELLGGAKLKAGDEIPLSFLKEGSASQGAGLVLEKVEVEARLIKEEKKNVLTEEEKREERRARDREGQRRRRALAKARREGVKVEIEEEEEVQVEGRGDVDEELYEDGGDHLSESRFKEDPSLPSGWKMATYILQDNGRPIPRFRAPDGTMFGSREEVEF